MMSESELISRKIRYKHTAEIAEAKTFETHGVSKQDIRSFLKTDEGSLFRQRLVEADPNSSAVTIYRRAIEQLASGNEIPRVQLSDEPLYKVVPRGNGVPSFSPFFARKGVFDEALAKGYNISGFFGLPLKSEAPRYDIYEMRPKAPTEIFIHHVAPTSELGGLSTKTGGGEQVLVPDRNLYYEPVYLKSIDNSLALRAERRMGAAIKGALGGAGVLVAAYDAYTTAEQYQALSAQGNQFGADALLRRYEGRTVGGLLGGIGAGVAYGFVAGSETGPGAFITGAVGGVVGAFAGDKIATMVTEHKVNHQTGTDGVTYVYEDGRWQNTHYQLDPAVASVPNPYGAASMRAVVTPAPAAQLAQLDYQRMTAIISLALANPATQDTRHIELDGTKWHATADGWAQQVQIPGVPNTYGIPSYITVDRPANARTTEALNQLAANRRFNNEHYAEDVAKAYVMDYYGKGWSANGPLPEVVTEALGLASEEHVADPRTGKVWNADGHGHFSREETRLIGRVVIHETHGASGEERTRLGQLEQLAVHSNADYGQQLIAQKYEKWLAAQLHVRASAESYAAVGADHQTPLESSPASHDAVVTAPLAAAGVAPITPASSDHAMFDALVTAARSLDIEAMRSIGQNYLQSERGQAWLAQGQQLNQQLALQAGREGQAQQAAVMQR